MRFKRVIDPGGLIYPPPYTGFALPNPDNYPARMVYMRNADFLEEVFAWCTEQFGPEMNRGEQPSLWFSSHHGVVFYDENDAMAFAMRWC
ncbi:MAG: hypothetical protein EOP83_31080 [Verrucomicrobiaceae bacterium]|nr:MAG: hypothetical protein EOP83_31080 [Verrucomicrobiaceae bacterium]